MAMAHQPLAALFGVLVGVAAEEGCDLGLDGLRQQRSRALAQNFGERVGELCWLDQLDDIILDHGVSLLRWRSGGLEHPHDTPPHPSRRHQLPRIPPAISASSTSGPSLIRPRQTARPSASSRLRCANGPTLRPTQPRTIALPRCRSGYTDTTGTG